MCTHAMFSFPFHGDWQCFSQVLDWLPHQPESQMVVDSENRKDNESDM